MLKTLTGDCNRTKMLREILEKLGEDYQSSIPQNIGEDELATYGAYRVNE